MQRTSADHDQVALPLAVIGAEAADWCQYRPRPSGRATSHSAPARSKLDMHPSSMAGRGCPGRSMYLGAPIAPAAGVAISGEESMS